MRRSSSAFLLAAVAATATLSTARPLSEVDLTAGNWKMPFFPAAQGLERRTYEEDSDDAAVFDPSSEADDLKVIKNPKMVLNPKNPYYSSSLASISSAKAARTSTSSSSSSTTPAAQTTTTTRAAAEATTTHAQAASQSHSWYLVPGASSSSSVSSALVPSSTVAPTTTTTTTTSAAASATPTGTVYTGGIATYFYQNGNPGNCGDYNLDTAMLVALPTKTYANGKYCGDWLTIKRVSTGATIQAFVADSCPSCENDSSLDLSVAAFQALEPDLDVGIFDIEWWFDDSSSSSSREKRTIEELE